MGRENVVAQSGHREGRLSLASLERGLDALRVLAGTAADVAAAENLAEALHAIAAAAAAAVRAEVVVIRVHDPETRALLAAAVASASHAVAAELEGTSFPADELPPREVDELDDAATAVARAARRVGADAVLQLPVSTPAGPASLELLRAGVPFDETERRVARVVATQVALAARAFPAGPAAEGADPLALAGDALAAAGEHAETAEQVVRVAVEATGALAGLLWQLADDAPPHLVASSRLEGSEVVLADAADAAVRATESVQAVLVEELEQLPAGAGVSASLRLGQPPVGALQLLFPVDAGPSEEQLRGLATYGVRAAHALRTSERIATTAAELERTRALLAIVGQATAQLSLTHTLDTAVEAVAELLGIERVAAYLRKDGRLEAVSGTGLAGPHLRLAERLLELVLGAYRGRGMLTVPNVATDSRLAAVGDAAAEAAIEGAVALPLLVRGEAIGLLAAFPDRGRTLTDNESALLRALATQLAVAVQNAQLHEQTKRLGEERERALESELAAARELRALYEISSSFAQSLSLDATLDAVAKTVANVLEVDVAVIGLPDERREWLVPRALHVRDARLHDVISAVVARPFAFGAQPLQRLFRLGEPVRITRRTISQLGPHAAALQPFVERGWSGAMVPVSSAAEEVLAALTIMSVRPDARVDDEVVRQAAALARQGALAIDNARLYQQQKEFADTMQRSLLPRSVPALQGLEVGDAYQSSSRVEVGGDVYDFLALDDGRLAVALGDVTGHGIEAAADMAMAKFVFRSLAREHTSPGAFLASANDVVVGEIAPGKFITMVYLVVDGAEGRVAAAGAGHPPPRVVDPDGTVRALDTHGLVLGIEAGERYAEATAPLERGGSVVLYTDGVLEARNEGELYGFERLDAIVSAGRELSAQDLAETVLADCRDFANNELADDCAVVVIKRI